MQKKLLTILSACIFLLTVSAFTFGQGPCREAGAIRSVTKARTGNFETVTFEIVGNTLPATVEVSNEHAPIENYGGDNLHMRGPYFKSVNLRMVPWTCTIRENVGSHTSTITGVKQTEQFEGYVSYVIGYTKRSKYVGKTTSTSGKNAKIVIKFKR